MNWMVFGGGVAAGALVGLAAGCLLGVARDKKPLIQVCYACGRLLESSGRVEYGTCERCQRLLRMAGREAT